MGDLLAGGVDPEQAATELPDELWAESWSHASRAAGERRQQYRADRVRYLAVQAIRRVPHIFGLDEERAKPWRSAYEVVLHNHLEKANPAVDPHRAPELFTQSTLWNGWDRQFSEGPLALPVAAPAQFGTGSEIDDLHRRQVARTLLGQTFRLTDTLLDLYFADKVAEESDGDFVHTFLSWLSSTDLAARQVRHDCAQWLAHIRLIVDGCLDGAGRPWRELAREESWPQLFNPMAVIGVTGGSGAHRSATRQFRTPSLPRVIVCTDTLKEGVDLHLFCDRVLHYGVAWTSGDLEQRVGRVDRFFSQIERRLSAEGSPPDVQLHVGYPHIVASLERGQVERVIERQRRAELLMDSPLAGARREAKDFIAGASTSDSEEQRLEPYRPHSFPNHGRSIVAVPAASAQSIADHYVQWYESLLGFIRDRGWDVTPRDTVPVRKATLHGEGRQHEIGWSFDAALGRYILTLSSPPWPSATNFSGGARRCLVGRTRRIETFIRLLVPTPDEGCDTVAITRLGQAIEGAPPCKLANANMFWDDALISVANGRIEWLDDHKARIVVPRGNRSHTITLYAYEGGVRVVGVIAPLTELGYRSDWGDEPSPDRVRDWALDVTNNLALGYLDLHERDGLVFGIHALHGVISEDARRRLVQEVACRADVWEASLTGTDRW